MGVGLVEKLITAEYRDEVSRPPGTSRPHFSQSPFFRFTPRRSHNRFVNSCLKVANVLNKALSGEGTDDFIFPLFTKQGERVEVCPSSHPHVCVPGQLLSGSGSLGLA